MPHLLNSKFSNFVFSFPQKWLHEDIEEKYKVFFNRLPVPYRNATDYLNYTIQSVSWPGIDASGPTQQLAGLEVDYRSGHNLQRVSPKTFDVTFRTTEGFLNYWIMHDMLEKYIEYKYKDDPNDSPFLNDVTLQILDHYGYLIMTKTYHSIVFNSITELQLSYSSNVPEYQTFSCGFTSNGFSIKKELQ